MTAATSLSFSINVLQVIGTGDAALRIRVPDRTFVAVDLRREEKALSLAAWLHGPTGGDRPVAAIDAWWTRGTTGSGQMILVLPVYMRAILKAASFASVPRW